MTYPPQNQQPGYPPAPEYPPQQQPGYGQQPGYPPAQPSYPPQQPGYPPAQAPGYPPQQAGYGQPQGYPPQNGYGQPPAPQGPPPPQTGLSDYASQPSMSGGALNWPTPGHRIRMTVTRDLADADFPPQTDPQGNVRYFRDGRPMVVMVVPVRVPPDAAHPDGHAAWWVRGQAGEALKTAMAAVGAGHLNGIPEKDSVIDVLFTMTKPAKRAGNNPSKIYEVTYHRPPGANGSTEVPQYAADPNAHMQAVVAGFQGQQPPPVYREVYQQPGYPPAEQPQQQPSPQAQPSYQQPPFQYQQDQQVAAQTAQYQQPAPPVQPPAPAPAPQGATQGWAPPPGMDEETARQLAMVLNVPQGQPAPQQ